MNSKSYCRFLKTLGNINRLSILLYLAEDANNAKNVSEIIKGVELEQTQTSHHLKRLLECSFVEVTQKGKERFYTLNHETIEPLLKLLERHASKYCSKCSI